MSSQPALAMMLRSLVAATVMVPIFWTRDFSRVWNRREMTILLGLGLCGTALNQFFWTSGMAIATAGLAILQALERIPASRMAAFQYLQPVFASLMAILMPGEDLTGGALAAGGIISTDVFVAERFG